MYEYGFNMHADNDESCPLLATILDLYKAGPTFWYTPLLMKISGLHELEYGIVAQVKQGVCKTVRMSKLLILIMQNYSFCIGSCYILVI